MEYANHPEPCAPSSPLIPMYFVSSRIMYFLFCLFFLLPLNILSTECMWSCIHVLRYTYTFHPPMDYTSTTNLFVSRVHITLSLQFQSLFVSFSVHTFACTCMQTYTPFPVVYTHPELCLSMNACDECHNCS